ncbi:MAG: cadherin-like domain-containing protein [Myxococcales bacterium]
MLGVSFPARAVLERVGPTDPTLSGGGFPAWYQDTSGLALEFCSPSNVSEVAGGWCLLLPADVPVIPESFPGNFFDEHFYFAGDATLSPVSGGKALLRVSEEAAFAGAGVPFAGQQITFSRIRVKLTGIPVTGIYRFIHPYGEESIFATAGSPRGIFFTDDVGINCPPGGPFDCALQSRLGPFLLPSAVAGGAEMAALTAANPTPDTDPAHFGGVFAATPYPGTGKSYIADPARIGPVTGSPLGTFTDSTGAARDHNIFRIEGPAGSNLGGPGIDFIETTNFALQGRIFASTIAGRVTVDRASYTKSATATKLDVFASGSETIQGRLPTQPRPVGVSPALSFFEAPCDTDPVTFALIAPLVVIDQQMFQDATYFWGQSVPALIPAAVCVKDSAARDATGQIVPAFFQAKVTDEISISKAVYDPDTATLTVNATSSDTVSAPVLSVDGFGDLTLGALSYAPLMASPAKVRVRSTLGGFADLDVTTNFFGAAPGALRALNDAFTFAEDSGAQILNVLANDTSAAGGTVVVIAQPKLGTAIANPLDNTVTYTPAVNANGVDAFTYQVTTAAGKSNIANVTVTITPVNDPPTAVNDGPFTVIAGRATPTALPNLLDNDIDPDGRADMVSAVQIVPGAGLIVTGGVGGVVTVSSAQPGTFSFTYKVVDKAGVVSANAATVTVVAIPGDTVTITKAQFAIGPRRWVVTGTTSVPNQSINLTYVNGTLPGWSIGTVAVDALGNWTLDIRNVTGNDDPTTFLKRPTTLKATSTAGGSATVTITYK